MGLRRMVTTRKSAVAAEEEKSVNLSSDGELEKGNLHEMETQLIMDEDDDNETGGSPTSGNNASSVASPLLLEGRRTRSGKSLGESNNTPKPKRLPKPRPIKPKRAMRSFPLSSSAKVKIIPKITAKIPPKETDPAKSEKSPELSNESNIDKDLENGDSTEATVPLAEFMAKLNASPSSSNGDKAIAVSECTSEQESAKPSTECPQETSVANDGKLRSSIADSEGRALARRYKHSLRETEEFALNYISQEFHHPVISCFRELNRKDISTIVGSSKLKKSCNHLEQSIIYLGLIDMLATVNNNPVYGESDSTKLSKQISPAVQKILLEFKNILGNWALSGNEQLSSRYSLILNYLRTLVPMFKKAGFDEGLSNILDRIEKEVTRHKQNQEKIKAMGSTPRGLENSSENKVSSSTNESQDGENRSALNEIILNVDLNVKLDDSDDDDDEVAVVKEESSLQIFGKPLKQSSRNTEFSKKRSKKPKGTFDFKNNEIFKSPTTQQNRDKTPKSHMPTKKASMPPPKTLSKVFQTSDSPKTSTNKSENSSNKTPPTKRNASEDLAGMNDVTKKRKIEDGSVKANVSEGKSSIKSFFQPVASTSGSSPAPSKSEKPAVNAFALMMNRSREIAQKKKLDKLNTIPVASLKVKS